MKLSKKQMEVIKLMREGWELGKMDRQLNASTPLPDRYWLQKGGLRKGGETKNLKSSTVFSLIKAGVLTPIIFKQSSLTMFGETVSINP